MALPGRRGPIGGGRLRGGILSAARPLDAELSDWRQGVTFTPACVDTSAVRVRGCVDPVDSQDKDSDPVAGPVEFNPFLVYSMTDCSAWLEPEMLEQLAVNGADRILSQTIAQQLQENTVADSNSPSLNSEAVDITPDTPVDLSATLGLLLNAMVCGCAVNEVVFHAPIRSLPFFLEKQLVEFDATQGVYHMGDHVFSFDCYGEVGPDDTETSADGSEIWIYATGPVEFAVGPTEVVTRPDGLTILTNEAVSLSEGLAIVRFDTCCVRAAIAAVVEV